MYIYKDPHLSKLSLNDKKFVAVYNIMEKDHLTLAEKEKEFEMTSKLIDLIETEQVRREEEIRIKREGSQCEKDRYEYGSCCGPIVTSFRFLIKSLLCILAGIITYIVAKGLLTNEKSSAPENPTPVQGSFLSLISNNTNGRSY